MGVRISHIKRSETQPNDADQNASDTLKSSRSLLSDFQRNDNATKVIPFEQELLQTQRQQQQQQEELETKQQQQREQDQEPQPKQQLRPSLPHTDYRSSPAVSTINSKTKSCLGNSSSKEPRRLTALRSHLRTQNFDRSRSRQMMTRGSFTRPHIQRPNSDQSRPPWRSSVIRSPLISNKMGSRPILIPSHCPRRQVKRTNGRRACWSSLSCLSYSRAVDNEAHLRRCSAARMAQANRSDLLDTSGVDQKTTALGNQEKPTGTTKVTSASRPKNFQSSFSHPVFRRRRSSHQTSFEKVWERQHTWNSKSPDVIFDPLTTAISDSSTDIESIDPFSTVRENAFPLRYVFYVEDNPRSLRIFGYYGRGSQMARETHCRVEFHTQIQRKDAVLTSMFNRTPNCTDNTQPVEPVLYHQGKRVRPVTVAAPNLNALLSFVKQLDHNFPEFEASRFLSDRLDKTNYEISTHSNQEIFA